MRFRRVESMKIDRICPPLESPRDTATTIRLSEDLKTSLLFFFFLFPSASAPLALSRIALALGCAPRLGRISRNRAGPGDGAAAAAAARSPSEVKVRRVGTGCARIHFFGLALDFFLLFPAGEARGISFPCMRRRPSLHGRLARYLPAAHAHGTRSCASHVSRRFSLPHVLSLFFALVPVAPCSSAVCIHEHTRAERVSPIFARTRVYAHVCGTDGTLAGSSP